MSTHAVNVVEIESVEPHPDADALELTNIGGWQCVIRKGQFKPGDRAVYVEPDYVVPTSRPEFAFLDKKGAGRPHRLKAVKLRGAISYGLLIPIPASLMEWLVNNDTYTNEEGVKFHFNLVGRNVMEPLGIIRYEPAVNSRNGGFSKVAGPAPAGLVIPKFDLENMNKHHEVFEPGEYVYVTEKLHGANARFMHWEGEDWVGSRAQWSKQPDDGQNKSWWWTAFEKYPGIAEYCRANPGHILYGEVYGDVQELKYGTKPGTILFAAFALLDATTGKWLDYNDLRARCMATGIPLAPLVYEGPYDYTLVRSLAEEDSVATRWNDPDASQLSEGVVIVPLHERQEYRLGRVALKHISQRYWLL